MTIDTTTWLCGSPPNTGQRQRYPSRFIYNLKKFYPLEGKRVLTIFSGSSDIGDTVDIRAETGAKIVGSYENLPIQDNTYDFVLADPPYNELYAKEWKSNLPKPKLILGEGSRVCKLGGLIAILHCIVVPCYKVYPVERVAIHPVLCGPNNAIRCLSVFKKTKEVTPASSQL